MSDHLIAPHGGTLVNLVVDAERAAEMKAAATDWPSWDLTPRQVCDLELLMNGAFSPLTTFLGQSDYESVCSQMRLADGTLWPMPICLDVPEELADGRSRPSRWLCATRRASSSASSTSTRSGTPDREAEAQQVFGTIDTKHPGVAHLLNKTNPVLRRGRLEGLAAPASTTTSGRCARHRPSCATSSPTLGWTKVVAFQTRNPMHRAHHEITLRAAKES